MTVTVPAPDNLLQRLWIYQAERFPVVRTATLLAAFSAASINVSSFLAARPLPGAWTYGVAFTVVFCVFFQLRACDEVKDAEDDRRYRPERPIPRGLVSQGLIVGIGFALIPIAIAAAWSLSAALLVPLAAIWLWLALMTAEFGVPAWLKARPMLYLVSHMLIMPLIDLFVTGTDWIVRGGDAPAGLGLFLGLSFVNGCVLEIGRKLYAPANERVGVETYSGRYGVMTATRLWSACCGVSLCLLVAVGSAVGSPWVIGLVGLFAFAGTALIAIRYAGAPDPGWQKAIDAAAGVWVLVCYAAAGFLPLLRM